MFVGQHDKCVRQVTPPEETHDFGFHIAIWCLKVQKNPLIPSNLWLINHLQVIQKRRADLDNMLTEVFNILASHSHEAREILFT
jgi:hypothetical protein